MSRNHWYTLPPARLFLHRSSSDGGKLSLLIKHSKPWEGWREEKASQSDNFLENEYYKTKKTRPPYYDEHFCSDQRTILKYLAHTNNLPEAFNIDSLDTQPDSEYDDNHEYIRITAENAKNLHDNVQSLASIRMPNGATHSAKS